LFLNPYIESNNTSVMKLFPPTGLEYVATSAEGLVGRISMLDLRYEKEHSDTAKLLDFISKEIDIICVNIGWDRQFKEICDLLNRMLVDRIKEQETEAIEASKADPSALQRYQELRARRVQLMLQLEKSQTDGIIQG